MYATDVWSHPADAKYVHTFNDLWPLYQLPKTFSSCLWTAIIAVLTNNVFRPVTALHTVHHITEPAKNCSEAKMQASTSKHDNIQVRSQSCMQGATLYRNNRNAVTWLPVQQDP